MKLLNYFKSWTLDRYLRLIIGVVVAVLSIISKHYGLLILAAVFVFLAFANISSRGYGGKVYNGQDLKVEDKTTVDYEEID